MEMDHNYCQIKTKKRKKRKEGLRFDEDFITEHLKGILNEASNLQSVTFQHRKEEIVNALKQIQIEKICQLTEEATECLDIFADPNNGLLDKARFTYNRNHLMAERSFYCKLKVSFLVLPKFILLNNIDQELVISIFLVRFFNELFKCYCATEMKASENQPGPSAVKIQKTFECKLSASEIKKKEGNTIHQIAGYAIDQIIGFFECEDFWRNCLIPKEEAKEIYHAWTEKQDRGGLLYLSQTAYSFFFKVCDIICKYVDAKDPLRLNTTRNCNIKLELEKNQIINGLWDKLWSKDLENSNSAKLKCYQILINCHLKGLTRKCKSQIQSRKRDSLNSSGIRKELKVITQKKVLIKQLPK